MSLDKHPKQYILPILAMLLASIGFMFAFSESKLPREDNTAIKVTPHVIIQVQDSATLECVRCGYPNTVYIYKRVLIPDNGTNKNRRKGSKEDSIN